MRVIGAADHLSNNPIGQCTETRSICSAQITPPPRTLLDVSPRFSPDSVDNKQRSHTMTEARLRKQGGDARDSVDNRWLSTAGEGAGGVACKPSKLPMGAETDNRHRPPIAVIGWVIHKLIVER